MAAILKILPPPVDSRIKLYWLLFSLIFWNFCSLYVLAIGFCVLSWIAIMLVRRNSLSFKWLIFVAIYGLALALWNFAVTGQLVTSANQLALWYVRCLSIFWAAHTFSLPEIDMAFEWFCQPIPHRHRALVRLFLTELISIAVSLGKLYPRYHKKLLVREISFGRRPLPWLRAMTAGFLRECLTNSLTRALELQVRQQLIRAKSGTPKTKIEHQRAFSIQAIISILATLLLIGFLVIIPNSRNLP